MILIKAYIIKGDDYINKGFIYFFDRTSCKIPYYFSLKKSMFEISFFLLKLVGYVLNLIALHHKKLISLTIILISLFLSEFAMILIKLFAPS